MYVGVLRTVFSAYITRLLCSSGRDACIGQAAKMAQQLQEMLAKGHVQHQNLRGSEFSAKSQLEQTKSELESIEVRSPFRIDLDYWD